MNLENDLYNGIEFTNRRKRGIIQPRYMCAIKWLSEDNSFLGSGSSPTFKYSDPYANSPSPMKPVKPSWTVPTPVVQEKPEEKKSNPTTIVDFPYSGFQLHYHEQEDGSIIGGQLISHDRKDKFSLDNYKISTGALYAALLGYEEIKSDE